MRNTVSKRSLPFRIIASFLMIVLIAFSFFGCFGNKSAILASMFEQDNGAGTSVDDAPVIDATIFKDREDIAYVLIYNPDIYYEGSNNNRTVNTGSFGEWIDTSAISRSGDSEPELPFMPVSQGTFLKDFNLDEVDFSGQRGSVVQPDFQIGDTRDFYHESPYTPDVNTKDTFKCVYSGTHCCFWIPEWSTVPDSGILDRVAAEFDNTIYDADVETFGKPRYADENGKIHVVFSQMYSRQTLGYFHQGELFTHDEVDDYTAEKYGVNRDLAVIHLNADYLENPLWETVICATLAHELQHLICHTAAVEYNQMVAVPTWINEAMSGYIEEKLYPGIKEIEGHYDAFSGSDQIRQGQSMYNFDNSSDIGVYGSVFLFSQYLENNFGSDVFKNFHQYWRTTFDRFKLYDADAFNAVIPENAKSQILEKYTFPSGTRLFSDESSELMSKLTLDFYISLLKYDSSDPDAYRNVSAQTLLYDEINPANIEGGGRVIIATKDGHFEIPDNAESTLVFIGFDENFNQITDAVVW